MTPAETYPRGAWVPGSKYAQKCRYGTACTHSLCGFAHPLSWHEAMRAQKDASKGKSKGKHDRSVKGPEELEDRSFHRVDGVTGLRIGRRRQNEARAREQFFGTILDADGNEVINDCGDTDA